MARGSVLAVLALVGAACGGGTGGTTSTAASTTTAAVTTTGASATTTTLAATTTTQAASQPLTMNDDGSYTIAWDALTGTVYFAPPVDGAADPFFHVHNDPAADGFFFSVEAYTTGYGTAWTGELGQFTIDCTPAGTGICVHFDPDGPGPIGNLGADFMATGDVEIVQADADGFVAIFSNVEFSDGTTIPGPFTISG